MNTVEVKGALRSELGKPEAKKLRKEGQVPCVLYGTENPIHFSTETNSFKKLVYTPDAYLVKLDIDGKTYDAILQDSQYHPVSDAIIHADFLVISENKPVVIEIPVQTTGSSKGVIAGGRLSVNLRTVKIKALPSVLPDVVEVDITNLKIGDSVKIKNLKLAEGVEALNNENSVVVAVKTTRVSRSGGGLEDEEEAEESTEEGAVAEEATAEA